MASNVNLILQGAMRNAQSQAQSNGLPTYAQLREQRKSQEKMMQNVATVNALTGVPVDGNMLAEANARLNSVLSPRQIAGRGAGSIQTQRGLVQQDLNNLAQTGQLDPTTLLTGLMRLDQLEKAKEESFQKFKSFAKGAIKPLEASPIKVKPPDNSGYESALGYE